MSLIYLDNNATTRVSQEVIDEMQVYYSDKYGNPSSIHEFGGQVSRDIYHARTQVSNLINSESPDNIFFTSCGTESSNTAIIGSLRKLKNKYKNKKTHEKFHIITTQVEHSCVLNIFKYLEKQEDKYEVTYISVDSSGNLNLQELEASIKENTVLVACMYVNNETGVIFPAKKIVELIKNKNPEILVFIDAVQALGKIPVDIQDLKPDMLSLSGHKIHAPKGIGVLYLKNKNLIEPFMIGGHQEKNRRAGTENVASIIGLGKACELISENFQSENSKINKIKYLRDKLETEIIKRVYNAEIVGKNAPRVPNTSNISFKFIEGELILLYLSDLGICASSGSACTTGDIQPSHVLMAMNLPYTSIHGSIRFSLSKYTTEQEINKTIELVPQVIEKINKISPYEQELAELKNKIIL